MEHNLRASSRARSRGGYIILMLTVAILTATFLSLSVFYRVAVSEYRQITAQAQMTKARYLAQSGLATAMEILRKVPQKQLYRYGVIGQLPPFSYEGSTISIAISEESGKVNVNSLVNSFDDGVNTATQEMLARLATHFGFSHEKWDAVIDWIDENNVRMPAGFEMADYQSMDPPRIVKNGVLHSVEELLMIPGFDDWMLYSDFRTEEQKKAFSTDFYSPEQLLAVQDVDYILANNLTVFLPVNNRDNAWKININSAPYHVILALSEFMTPEAARAVVVERINNGGFFENQPALAKVTQLHQKSVANLTLLEEIQRFIVFENRLYKVVVDASSGSHNVTIMGIYDKSAGQLAQYLQ